jgi:rhodanese-related sulfurtransferase
MKRFAFLCCMLPGILSPVNAQDTADSVYTDLNPEDFYILMNSTDNHVLIDTRTYREYRRERIQGAVLAADSRALTQLTEDLDFEQPLLVYCSDNYRSQDACRILVEKGFTKVYNLLGGLREWKLRGFETDRKRLPRNNYFSH